MAQGAGEFKQVAAAYEAANDAAAALDVLSRAAELDPGDLDIRAHLALAYAGPGDRTVIPDPGYNAYLGGTRLAGAERIIISFIKTRCLSVSESFETSSKSKPAKLRFVSSDSEILCVSKNLTTLKKK